MKFKDMFVKRIPSGQLYLSEGKNSPVGVYEQQLIDYEKRTNHAYY